MTGEPFRPGEVLYAPGPITVNAGRETIELEAVNTGDRPIQVGSHFHFFEVNAALEFDRDAARGRHLSIPAGTSVRFEPGIARRVTLVGFAGRRVIAGFTGAIAGPLDE